MSPPAVIELRQYTLHPGRRDELIDLFDREFVESQEDAGISLIGQFRDLDDPDRFVWLRGFPDMAARKASLKAFYSSPVWRAHRAAANATMIDSDDVLLLKPLGTGDDLLLGERARSGAGGPGRGVVIGGVHPMSGPDFGADLAPALAAAVLRPVLTLVTEASPNTFPGLPVREGESVLVWLAAYPDLTAADAALLRARADPVLAGWLAVALQVLRIQPTARSRLQG